MVEYLLIATLVVAFGYPALLRLQLERARPIRDRLVDLGKEMLGSPRYSEDQKYIISMMLEDALNWRIMAHAVLAMPGIIARSVFAGPRDQEAMALVRDEKFSEFVDLHLRSAMAASPILALLFRVEVALAAFSLGLLLMPYLVLEVVMKATSRTVGSRRLNHA
jgi:hypothetical protein